MEKLRINKLSLYVTKELLKIISIMIISIILLIFVIDFSEVANDAKSNNIALWVAFKVVVLKIPTFLENSLQFIMLLSALFTFMRLSRSHEITIMKISQMSIFQFLRVPVFVVFLIGVFTVLVVNPVSSISNRLSQKLENIHFKKEAVDFLELSSGLWFKQKNLVIQEEKIQENGEIVIRADRVYRDEIVFSNIILTYTDLEGNFLQRVNAKKMKFDDNGFWFLQDVFVIKEKVKAEYMSQMIIPTSLDREFILKKIRNDYESLDNISFWDLPVIIKDSVVSGFDSRKFQVRFFYLLTVPIIFVSMIYFAAFFAISNERVTKNTLMIMLGILSGFIIYIIHNVLIQLAVSGKISVVNAVFTPVLLYVFIGLFLVIKKEELSLKV